MHVFIFFASLEKLFFALSQASIFTLVERSRLTPLAPNKTNYKQTKTKQRPKTIYVDG